MGVVVCVVVVVVDDVVVVVLCLCLAPLLHCPREQRDSQTRFVFCFTPALHRAIRLLLSLSLLLSLRCCCCCRCFECRQEGTNSYHVACVSIFVRIRFLVGVQSRANS